MTDEEDSTLEDKPKCTNWIFCPYAVCIGETYEEEKYHCKICQEVWTVYYGDIQ